MSTAGKRPYAKLIVRQLSSSDARGLLEFGAMRVPCALGRSGVRAVKTESDGATPRGDWRLLTVLFNPLRARRPRGALPIRALRRSDGWCDAPGDRNYNRRVQHPYAASAECLWRDDGLYDVVVVLGYNVLPRIRSRGSAIFLHVARPGFAPTEGCVAVRRDHLMRILSRVGTSATIRTAK